MWKLVFPVLAALLAVGLGGLVGAPRQIDVNDSGALEALGVAVAQHNLRGNDRYLNQVANVIRVERQMVAGSLYTITVEMGRTSCVKTGAKQSANQVCDFFVGDAPEARRYECTFTVWSRPWLTDGIEVTAQKC